MHTLVLNTVYESRCTQKTWILLKKVDAKFSLEYCFEKTVAHISIEYC